MLCARIAHGLVHVREYAVLRRVVLDDNTRHPRCANARHTVRMTAARTTSHTHLPSTCTTSCMNTGTARANTVRARTAAACVAIADVRPRVVPPVVVAMVTMCDSVSVGRPDPPISLLHYSYTSPTICIQRQRAQHRAHNRCTNLPFHTQHNCQQ